MKESPLTKTKVNRLVTFRGSALVITLEVDENYEPYIKNIRCFEDVSEELQTILLDWNDRNI